MAKADIAEKVGKILNTPNLDCLSADTVLEALDLYVTKNVDFIDAFHGVMLREAGIKEALTHDKRHFQRMDWLSVVEP